VLFLLCIISAVIAGPATVKLRRGFWFGLSLMMLILSTIIYTLVYSGYLNAHAINAHRPDTVLAFNLLVMKISMVASIVLFFVNKKKYKKNPNPINIREQFRLSLEKRRLRDSFKWQFVRQDKPGGIKYYENGRMTLVPWEIMPDGHSRRIDDKCINWSDNGQALTSEEKQRALAKVCKYFDESGIKWQFKK
jgi:hypothetical protein